MGGSRGSQNISLPKHQHVPESTPSQHHHSSIHWRIQPTLRLSWRFSRLSFTNTMEKRKFNTKPSNTNLSYQILQRHINHRTMLNYLFGSSILSKSINETEINQWYTLWRFTLSSQKYPPRFLYSLSNIWIILNQGRYDLHQWSRTCYGMDQCQSLLQCPSFSLNYTTSYDCSPDKHDRR